MIFENRLIYFPPNGSFANWQPSHLDFEEANFVASDGTRLHGWYFPHPAPRGYVLYCHGNADFVPNLGDFANELRERYELSTLIWDYRGYGKSEGKPNEKGVLADATAARQWLVEHERGISAADISLMGRSLGGAVAVHLAATGPCRCLILDSTFSSMRDVAAHHYSLLPVRWLMRTRFDSAEKIKGYSGPLLQLHGDKDEVVPIQFGKALFEVATGPKEFFLFRNGDHNGPRPIAFHDRMSEFIQSQGEPPASAGGSRGPNQNARR